MDKKKTNVFIGTIAIVLLLSFFSAIVIAFQEGDLISRATFSQQDFSSQNLNCNHEGNKKMLNQRPVMFEVYVSCLSATILDDENVIVERWTEAYPIQINGTTNANVQEWTQPDYNGVLPSIKECTLEGYTKMQCWNNLFKPRIIDLVKETQGSIRLYLNDLRDPEIITINPNDFGITDEELND